MKRIQILSVATPLALVAATLAVGDLNPPAGSVVATGKRLTELEPRTALSSANTPGDANSVFRITQPGSYYLTGNVSGASGFSGIEIASSNVTVDLNGFSLLGATGSIDGILVAAAGLRDIAIQNGTVSGWGDDGIDLVILSTNNVRVQGVLASSNGGGGILCSSSFLIENCSAHQNGAGGIWTSSQGVIRGCSATFNTNIGIWAGSGCVVENCNSSSNAGEGYLAQSGSCVSNCTARLNDGNGIRANGTGYASISGCTVTENGGDGIQVGTSTLVARNVATQNGRLAVGAGIRASGSLNRLEDNTCTANDKGIEVDAAANVVVRNTCAANTVNNWDIVPNNICGPILDRTAPASAAILGSSGVSSLGSTDANANYSH